MREKNIFKCFQQAMRSLVYTKTAYCGSCGDYCPVDDDCGLCTDCIHGLQKTTKTFVEHIREKRSRGDDIDHA